MPEVDYSEAIEHYDDMRRIALSRCETEAEAEDVLQRTYEKALENWDKYESGTNCKGWLSTILRNTQINRYRRRTNDKHPTPTDFSETRSPSGDDGWLAEGFESPDSVDGISEEIEWAIQQLSDKFRYVLLLVAFHDFSYKEVAYVLDIPIGTVMSRLYRARREIKPLVALHAKEMGIGE